MRYTGREYIGHSIKSFDEETLLKFRGYRTPTLNRTLLIAPQETSHSAHLCGGQLLILLLIIDDGDGLVLR